MELKEENNVKIQEGTQESRTRARCIRPWLSLSSQGGLQHVDTQASSMATMALLITVSSFSAQRLE